MIAVMGLLVASTVMTNKIDHTYFVFRNMVKPGPRPPQEQIEDVLALKTRFSDTSLSVDYILLPFFADRNACYMWPNPLKRSNYGTGRKIRIDTYPEYVILKTSRFGSEETRILDRHGYGEYRRTDNLLIFKAENAPDIELPNEYYQWK